ncbi:hypothetical protein [Psychrobacter sp. I-STPA6b]|uniref:hypothetical protein n=1 Tax=Psychrobacter sp. I-STPA6b TaxID=2585718 RepID=UPI001D0C4988|nr:hypothetical protein [Psychrobacter sp. I-STPA6b]
MATIQQEILIKDEASKIFLFDEVYTFRAAQEQAEKKKLNAFGMMAKLNPLKRPKEDTVQLSRIDRRLEPFWHIEAVKSVDYDCQITYQVPVHNPFVQSIQIEGETYEVTRNKEKARIDIPALESCHRKIYYDRLLDGLKRDIRAEVFASYAEKYKFEEISRVEEGNNVIEPLLPQQAAIQQACAVLNSEAVNAHDVHKNSIVFEKLYLFLVPVFAFEFVWGTADKTGVIEVNGLTGDVIENGEWYKDKINQLLTREMLVDISADLAGELIPGGSIAVKVVGRLADSQRATSNQ